MVPFGFTELDQIKYSAYFMFTYSAKVHTLPTATKASTILYYHIADSTLNILHALAHIIVTAILSHFFQTQRLK